MDQKHHRSSLLARRRSANTLAPQIELHAVFICPIFMGPYFCVFGRHHRSETGYKPGAHVKAGALEDRTAGMVGPAHVGLPKRLPLTIINGLIFGILAHYRIGGAATRPAI